MHKRAGLKAFARDHFAQYITHCFLYLKAKVVIDALKKKNVNLKNAPELAFINHPT